MISISEKNPVIDNYALWAICYHQVCGANCGIFQRHSAETAGIQFCISLLIIFES